MMVNTAQVLGFFGSIRETLSGWVYKGATATVGTIPGAKITETWSAGLTYLILGIIIYFVIKFVSNTEKHIVSPLWKFALYLLAIVLVVSLFVPF